MTRSFLESCSCMLWVFSRKQIGVGFDIPRLSLNSNFLNLCLFSEGNLKAVVSNLFVGGTETTSTTLMWSLLFAIHYPEVQKKVLRQN